MIPHDAVYLSIDFELVNRRGGTLAYALVVAHYPTGRILDSAHGTCIRGLHEYDHCTYKFWHTNYEAYLMLLQKASMCPREMEIKMTEDFTRMLKRWPDIVIVSDNPATDVGLLDNALIRSNLDPSCFRPNGKYYQPICSWSYRLGLSLPQSKSPLLRDTGKYYAPRHTPIADCARVLDASSEKTIKASSF